MDIELLVRKALKGDDEAFYALVQSRKEILYRTAYAYVKNEEDSLDILSETTYKAYKSIKKLKSPEYFNTWITRILINCAVDFIRKRKRIVFIEDESMPADAAEDIEREDIIDVNNSIDKLDVKLKTIIILKYFHDMTLKEISEMLEMPLGTVKTYLNKALKIMRADLIEEVEANGTE